MKGNTNTVGRLLSEATRKKMSASARKGEASNFWKGGATEENKRLRMSSEFRRWREAVFARDDWTCRECGTRGGRLHPHHIKRFSEFPELRFDVDNGITLCVPCHKETPNYGRKK
jgi:hypothetical protein